MNMAADAGATSTKHAVAVFDPGDKDYNTIAFPSVEIIVPLAEDADCDPLQDDEVRLQSLDESYEKIVKASDPEAEVKRGEGLIYYHFVDVPPGFYRISVRISESWVDLSADLAVTPRGASFLGKKLTTGTAPAKAAVRLHRFKEAPPLEAEPELDISDNPGPPEG
jgi:hypothetical protein